VRMRNCTQQEGIQQRENIFCSSAKRPHPE
jgi:hypothetical protein